jgi:hypothetical protein
MGMRTSVVGRLALALASIAWEPPARAEVVVVAGRADGRRGAAADAAGINEPFATAFDAEGRMYGVEYGRGNRLFRVARPDEAGAAMEFVAGVFRSTTPKDQFPPDSATAANAVQFHGLHDVAVGRDGTVYVADTFAHQVRAFDPATRTVRVIAGTGRPGFSGDGGPAVRAEFNQAYCASLTPDAQALLVADIKNARLRRIDLVTGTVATVAGNGKGGKPVDGAPSLETPLAGPRAACEAADGTIYLALREGNSLVAIEKGVIRTIVNASGKAGHCGDAGPGRDALLAGPKYVSLDRQGRVLIADTENHCIRRWDPATGMIELVAGRPTRKGTAIGADLLATELARPHGCALDPAGRLVIADSDNDRVLAGPVD